MAISNTFGPSGGAGDEGVVTVKNITSQINGDTQAFTVLKTYEIRSLQVFWNGLQHIHDVGITETGARSFTTSFTPQPGDTLVVVYNA